MCKLDLDDVAEALFPYAPEILYLTACSVNFPELTARVVFPEESPLLRIGRQLEHVGSSEIETAFSQAAYLLCGYRNRADFQFGHADFERTYFRRAFVDYGTSHLNRNEEASLHMRCTCRRAFLGREWLWLEGYVDDVVWTRRIAVIDRPSDRRTRNAR